MHPSVLPTRQHTSEEMHMQNAHPQPSLANLNPAFAPFVAPFVAPFAPPARFPEHVHGATGPADYLSAADVRARLEDRSSTAADKVVAAIAAVSAAAMTPDLVAQVAQALLAKCRHLSREARESAQGYLADLADDMRHFAEQDA